jgi:hypothetical protein
VPSWFSPEKPVGRLEFRLWLRRRSLQAGKPARVERPLVWLTSLSSSIFIMLPDFRVLDIWIKAALPPIQFRRMKQRNGLRPGDLWIATWL